MYEILNTISSTTSVQVAAFLIVVFLAYRVVRYALRSVGQFAEWVCDDHARIRVACYSLAAVLGVGGMFTTGVGVSRLAAAPEKIMNDQQRRKMFMDDIAAKMASTFDKDRLEALKHLAETYDKNYDRYRSDNPAATVSDARDYSPGAPLVFGGAGMVAVSILLCIRTAAKYD